MVKRKNKLEELSVRQTDFLEELKEKRGIYNIFCNTDITRQEVQKWRRSSMIFEHNFLKLIGLKPNQIDFLLFLKKTL